MNSDTHRTLPVNSKHLTNLPGYHRPPELRLLTSDPWAVKTIGMSCFLAKSITATALHPKWACISAGRLALRNCENRRATCTGGLPNQCDPRLNR